MGKIERKFLAHFIDASLTATPAYARLGDDLEEFNVEMNAEVTSTQNILGRTSKNISSYEPQSSVEPFYANPDDPIYPKLQKIIDERLVLDDLKSTAIEVHSWEEDEENPGTFVAYKEDVLIEIASYGGPSTGYQITFNIHYIGNRVKGTFNATSNTFTAA